MRRAVAPGLLATLAYLALALLCLRAIARHPASLLPYPAEAEKHGVLPLDRADQAFTVRAIADNANRLVTAPSTLFATGQCHPFPHPQTLGEHLLGESLLAAAPFALTRDPILTFNAVVLLSLLVPALAMYALARTWTGNAAAGFVAGLLFAFHPGRLVTASKPFIAGNGWTPLVLLFLHRLILRRRWRDAAWLGVASALQLLASFYQVLGAALLAGAYGAALALGVWWSRRRDDRVGSSPVPPLWPKLACVAALLAALAWALFAPYLEARAAWGVLQGRTPIFFYVQHFFVPHGPAFPGAIALLLALVGLADRARGPRPCAGEDPRLPILAAGLFVVWCLSTGVPIPGLGVIVPSPLALLARVVPGLDAVRVLPLARFAWFLAVAALAAFGVAALLDGAAARARGGAASALADAIAPASAAAIVALALVELLWAPVARRSFLEEPIVRAYAARPSDAEIALYRRVPPGAVLDLPLSSSEPRGALAALPALRAAAWHLRPIASCYNSFTTPITRDVEERARLLAGPAAPGAIEALAALGFASVLVHEGELAAGDRDRLEAALTGSGRATEIARTPGLALFAVAGGAPVEASLAALSGGALAPVTAAPLQAGSIVEVAPRALRQGAAGTVAIDFRNGSPRVYRHPEPIAPSDLRARWRAPGGEVVFTGRAHGLLPLALAPGESAARSIEVELPEAPGEYAIELSTTDDPERVLGRAAVRVISPAP